MNVLIAVVALLSPLWLLLVGGAIGDRVSQERTDSIISRLFGINNDGQEGQP